MRIDALYEISMVRFKYFRNNYKLKSRFFMKAGDFILFKIYYVFYIKGQRF
jgi:hypothetical protein